MANRYEGLFEDWEIGVAKNVIERFRKEWRCIEQEDFDDLMQECLTCWLFAKDNFDASAGANFRTFMSRVINKKLLRVARGLTRDKRNVANKSVSFDDRISDEEDAPTFLENLSEDEKLSSNLHISAELKFDISRTVQKLTPQQRELCRLLGEEGLNIKQASEALKIPRGTLYEDIKRIKAIFQKENLNEYLR